MPSKFAQPTIREPGEQKAKIPLEPGRAIQGASSSTNAPGAQQQQGHLQEQLDQQQRLLQWKQQQLSRYQQQQQQDGGQVQQQPKQPQTRRQTSMHWQTQLGEQQIPLALRAGVQQEKAWENAVMEQELAILQQELLYHQGMARRLRQQVERKMQQMKAFDSQAGFSQSLQENARNQGKMPNSFPLGVCEEEDEDDLAPPPEWAPIRTMPARPNADSVFNAAPTRVQRRFQPQPNQQLLLPHSMLPQSDQAPNQPLPCGMQPQPWKQQQQEHVFYPEPQNVQQAKRKPPLGLQLQQVAGISPSAEWDDDSFGDGIDLFRARTLPVNMGQHANRPTNLPMQSVHPDIFSAPHPGNTPQDAGPADELGIGPAIAWHRMRTMPAPPSQEIIQGGCSAGHPERHRDDNWKRAAGGGGNMHGVMPVLPLMMIPVPMTQSQGTGQGEVSAEQIARNLENAAPEFYED